MLAAPRLDFIATSVSTLEAALVSSTALAHALSVQVPSTWPPEFLDADALVFMRNRLVEYPHENAWWMYFLVMREPRVLLGTGAYKGPPDATGTVEIGYGIVAEQRRRGFAAEAARTLIAHAFAQPGVTRVIAETFPELVGSIAVMQRCGMRRVEGGSEPGVIRFAITRDDFARSAAQQLG